MTILPRMFPFAVSLSPANVLIVAVAFYLSGCGDSGAARMSVDDILKKASQAENVIVAHSGFGRKDLPWETRDVIQVLDALRGMKLERHFRKMGEGETIGINDRLYLSFQDHNGVELIKLTFVGDRTVIMQVERQNYVASIGGDAVVNQLLEMSDRKE